MGPFFSRGNVSALLYSLTNKAVIGFSWNKALGEGYIVC